MRVIINNIIYDITTFINEHPGGPNVFGVYNASANASANATDDRHKMGGGGIHRA